MEEVSSELERLKFYCQVHSISPDKLGFMLFEGNYGQKKEVNKDELTSTLKKK
jgi:hypothetical protein